MAKTDAILDEKRKRLAGKIKELASSIDLLVNMMDETRVDMALIALRSENLDRSPNE